MGIPPYKRPRTQGEDHMDINVQAFSLVRKATEESSPEDKRRRAASRRGGLVGGQRRAKVLSPEKRTEIAQKASRARWAAKQELASAS